jgi:hypothetical protein
MLIEQILNPNFIKKVSLKDLLSTSSLTGCSGTGWKSSSDDASTSDEE